MQTVGQMATLKYTCYFVCEQQVLPYYKLSIWWRKLTFISQAFNTGASSVHPQHLTFLKCTILVYVSSHGRDSCNKYCCLWICSTKLFLHTLGWPRAEFKYIHPPNPFTLNFCDRWRWVTNFTQRSPSEQKAGSAPESVWTLSRKVSYPDKNGTSICQFFSPGLGSKSRIRIVFSL